MGNASISSGFIFVKSETIPETTAKKAAWPSGELEKVDYEPIEEEEEWVAKEVKEQIISTISDIKTKKLKDYEKVYVVLGVTTNIYPHGDDPGKSRRQVFDPNVLNVLKRLSAEVLAYLNAEHNKFLVSCPISKLIEIRWEEKYSKKYFQSVKRIGPLLPKEQVSENLWKDPEWTNVAKPLVIQLIPNISDDKRKEYSSNLVGHLKGINAEPFDYENADFILVNLRQGQTEELLQASNFVFRVSEVPKGCLENVRLSKKGIRKRYRSVAGIASSIDSSNSEYDRLPIICLLDSGINEISQLNGLVLSKDGHYRFQDFNDDYKRHGHGTPIACLAVFDEALSTPKARIVSYKIYSDGNRLIYIEGYRRAVAKYANQARIFLSSINFERDNLAYTEYLDRLMQANNICAVFSAGNIDPKVVSDYASRDIPCSSYIFNYPVQDPAKAVNIVAVGAIAKKEAPNSISRRNELSPFTTCGTANSCLYQCPKPEVVQHGGNFCKDGKELGVESFNKYGAKVNDLLGTSFAAPILANHLAEIIAEYGDKFRNAETLKAIALASSDGDVQNCRGFGETKPFSYCDCLHALVCSEGEIPLPDVTNKHYRIDSTAKISIIIPKFVSSIKMFLVHSDNHHRVPMPYLNTYLKVKVKKTARDYGYVDLANPDELEKKSHMKVFKWVFKTQSMEGTWDFYITPEVTADMLPAHKKETTVRYGCAFLISSRSPARPVPLTEEMYHLNKR